MTVRGGLLCHLLFGVTESVRPTLRPLPLRPAAPGAWQACPRAAPAALHERAQRRPLRRGFSSRRGSELHGRGMPRLGRCELFKMKPSGTCAPVSPVYGSAASSNHQPLPGEFQNQDPSLGLQYTRDTRDTWDKFTFFTLER